MNLNPRTSSKNYSYNMIMVTIIIITLLSTACAEKRSIKVNSEPNYEFLHDYHGEFQTLDFKGIVLSMDNTPLNNASITIGDSTVTSNKNGEFEIHNHFIDRDFIPIMITHKGYKSRSMILVDKTNSQSIVIILKPYDSLNLDWFSKNNHLLD
jgi:hypothetical protein